MSSSFLNRKVNKKQRCRPGRIDWSKLGICIPMSKVKKLVEEAECRERTARLREQERQLCACDTFELLVSDPIAYSENLKTETMLRNFLDAPAGDADSGGLAAQPRQRCSSADRAD